MGLSLTVFELWPFEIWAKKRETPPLLPSLYPAPDPHRHTLYTSAWLCVQSARSHRCVKSSACVTVRKLWTAISRVSEVVASRSLRQISRQLSRKSSGINSFNVRREIVFVKVNNRHFVVRSAWTSCVKNFCVLGAIVLDRLKDFIRSTSKSRPNNIREGGKCPSLRPSVRPSVRPQKVSSIWMKFGV